MGSAEALATGGVTAEEAFFIGLEEQMETGVNTAPAGLGVETDGGVAAIFGKAVGRVAAQIGEGPTTAGNNNVRIAAFNSFVSIS